MRKILITIAISSLSLVLIAACTNEKKAVSYYDKHPEKLALLCSKQYSETTYEKDSTSVKEGTPHLLPASTINYNINKTIDSILNKLSDSTARKLQDSLRNNPIYVSVPCPASFTRVDTVIKYRYIQTTNTAKESYLQYRVDSTAGVLISSNTLCAQWRRKAEDREKTIIKLISVIVLFSAATIISFILKLRGKFPV